METRLIAMPTFVFDVCVRFGVRSSFWRARWIAGSVVATLDGSGIFGANFRANEAAYAFMAAIIAGTPMIFITRFIL